MKITLVVVLVVGCFENTARRVFGLFERNVKLTSTDSLTRNETKMLIVNFQFHGKHQKLQRHTQLLFASSY